MVYFIRNDFSKLLSKHKKIVIMYFVVIILFPFFCKIVADFDFSSDIVNNLYYSNIGQNYNVNTFLEYSMLLFYLTSYLYICLDLLISDFNYGKEYIFLRIKRTKWIIWKLISVIAITCTMTIFFNVALLITYSILGLKEETILTIFSLLPHIVLSTTILTTLGIFAIINFGQYSVFVIELLYSLPYFLKKIFGDDILSNLFTNLFASNSSIKISIVIFAILFALIIIKGQKITRIFERSF